MFQNDSIFYHNVPYIYSNAILRIVQQGNTQMEFKDRNARADQMEYLKMTHDVRDNQIKPTCI